MKEFSKSCSQWVFNGSWWIFMCILSPVKQTRVFNRLSSDQYMFCQNGDFFFVIKIHIEGDSVNNSYCVRLCTETLDLLLIMFWLFIMMEPFVSQWLTHAVYWTISGTREQVALFHGNVIWIPLMFYVHACCHGHYSCKLCPPVSYLPCLKYSSAFEGILVVYFWKTLLSPCSKKYFEYYLCHLCVHKQQI